MVDQTAKLNIDGLKVSYGSKQVIHGITFDIQPNEIFGVIGPAQSGKTSMLRVINRTIDFTANAHLEGTVKMEGQNIFHVKDVYEYRRRIGMVAPLPVGLPLTIYDNVAFAPRSFGMKGKNELNELVQQCLEQAALWDEVKDRLDTLGTMLSGGQQQRLTIARALSHQPEVLCLDEFSIAIDPVTTMKIEDVLKELRNEMTIILVTNLVQQARRFADRTMFLLNGNLIEVDDTEKMFSGNAKETKTNEFVSGAFG